jgi:CRP-like cAMP-binding protein
MNGIDGTFAQRAKAVLDLANDRLDHMVIAAGLDPAVDLRHGSWRDFDLSGADLRGFDFTGADLTGARFDNARIAGAIFDHSIYDPASLRNAADYEEFLRHPNFRGFDKRALLKTHWLFNGLSSEHIEHLAASSVGKSVLCAASIWAKGEPGSSLVAICQGTVKISVPSVDGHDAVLNVLGKGSIIGEIALLDGHPRTADATALTDCELFVIERREFLPLMRKEPEIALKMIELLCARLRRSTEQAPIAVPSPLSIPGLIAASTSGSGGGIGEPTGAPALPRAPAAPEQPVVQLAFDADRKQLHSAWQALANLADLCGHVAVSVKGEVSQGLDKSELENDVYEPLREAGLIK